MAFNLNRKLFFYVSSHPSKKKYQHLHFFSFDTYPKIYFYKNGDPAAKNKNDKILSNIK